MLSTNNKNIHPNLCNQSLILFSLAPNLPKLGSLYFVLLFFQPRLFCGRDKIATSDSKILEDVAFTRLNFCPCKVTLIFSFTHRLIKNDFIYLFGSTIDGRECLMTFSPSIVLLVYYISCIVL